MEKRTCRICEAARPKTNSPKGWKHFEKYDYCPSCRAEIEEFLNNHLLEVLDEYEMEQIIE